MALITGNDSICKDICDALGLKNVRKLNLKMSVGEIVTIDVEMYPEIDGVRQLPAILKRFELIEKIDSVKLANTIVIGGKIETYERIKD